VMKIAINLPLPKEHVQHALPTITVLRPTALKLVKLGTTAQEVIRRNHVHQENTVISQPKIVKHWAVILAQLLKRVKHLDSTLTTKLVKQDTIV
jgi:hypothetical protein